MSTATRAFHGTYTPKNRCTRTADFESQALTAEDGPFSGPEWYWCATHRRLGARLRSIRCASRLAIRPTGGYNQRPMPDLRPDKAQELGRLMLELHADFR